MARSTILAGLITAALAAPLAAPALAADAAAPALAPAAPASPWDFAFGGKLMTDDNFRGISQSARGPSVNVYGELRYNWLYAGASYWYTKLPNRPIGEIDFFGGIRPVIGNLTLDFGTTYYLYAPEKQFITSYVPGPSPTVTVPASALAGIWTPRNTDFWEFYGKANYDLTPQLNVGAAVYYAPNWLGMGAPGTYAEFNAKVKLPNDFAISGAIGHYWLGRTSFLPAGANFDIKDYLYWNAGVSWTFKDTVTLDLRYHGTNLNPTDCFNTTSDYRGVYTGSGRSNWCGHAVIATLSVDFTWSKLPLR